MSQKPPPKNGIRKNYLILFFFSSIIFYIFSLSNVFAVNKYCDRGVGTDNLGDAGNWFPDGVPVNFDNGIINNSYYTNPNILLNVNTNALARLQILSGAVSTSGGDRRIRLDGAPLDCVVIFKMLGNLIVGVK